MLLLLALRVLGIVLPTALANTMEFLPGLAAIIIVGHSRAAASDSDVKDALDAFSLARVYVNTVAIAPGFGYITALRTLCPQAVGAGMPRLCALYLQRALVVIAVGFLPALPLLFYADRVLVLLGQPTNIAALARPLCLRLAPQYFGYVGMSALQRVYQVHLQPSHLQSCRHGPFVAASCHL